MIRVIKMKKNEITNKEAEAIKEYRKQVKDKKKDRRLYAVQLRGEGLKVIEIAKKLDTYPQVVSQWVIILIPIQMMKNI